MVKQVIIKLKVLKYDVMENKLIYGGFVHGEFWFAKDNFFVQKSRHLHCNLWHTLKKGDHFDVKCVAGYYLVLQEDDVGNCTRKVIEVILINFSLKHKQNKTK